MTLTPINEIIEVFVTFNGSLVRPKAIRWRGRVIKIDSVNLVHSFRDGRKKLYTFAVSNRVAAYKLLFDSETLEWRLLELWAD